MFTRNRKIVLALVIGLFLILGIILSLSGPKSEEPKLLTVKPLENITLENSDKLKDLLLDRQYSAVVKGVSDLVHSKVSANVKTAAITMGPAVAKDGSVVFSATTKDPSRTFNITVDRSTYFDKIIIKVPGSGYSVTLPTYDTKTGD